VNKGMMVHHFIACEIDRAKKEIKAVNGNSTWQSILVKPLPISNISYFYRIKDWL
jgi:hypothetical protein